MRLRLNQVEPFNFPSSVANAAAQEFLAHFTGSEEFEFAGEEVPKSVLITSVQFTGHRSGVGKGLLLSVGVDTFFEIAGAESDKDGTFNLQGLARRYCLGLLELRLEPVWNTSVIAKPATL